LIGKVATQRKIMTDDEYMMALRKDLLFVADALRPDNIETCRHALRSIALGLIPESKLREMATCVIEEITDLAQWVAAKDKEQALDDKASKG
jgi:hypothetical protein